MKPFIAGIAAVSLACVSAGVQAGEISVVVKNIRALQGSLRVAVVNSEAGLGSKAEPIAARAVAVTGEEMTLRFPNLPGGTYAVMVMHDANGNGKLDTNLIGMPTEGYGFSNNPNVMRRPRYDEVSFAIGDAPLTVTINLR